MKEIKLTQEQVTIVDDEDYEFLMQWKWCAAKDMHNYYAMRRIKKNGIWTTVRMQRVIMNASIGLVVDHVNGNTLDNRRENLRVCTRAQNSQNFHYAIKGKSKFIGVSFNKQNSMWCAQINIKGTNYFLGYFSSEEGAAQIRDEFAKTFHREFARLNFI